MKTILSATLIALVMPAFADTIVFRAFSLDQAEGQDPLTTAQISEAIVQNELGQDNEVQIPVENDRFHHTTVKPIKFASEYNKDLTISKFDTKDLGIIIEGSIAKEGEYLDVAFSYSETTKSGGVIYGTNENRAMLMPKFKSMSLSSSLVQNREDSQWMVMPVPTAPESSTREYIAYRIEKEKK
ncbi:MAG: hypothetical protein ABI162_05605 [Luteolibacter sp.]